MSQTKRKTCEHWATHLVPDFHTDFVQSIQKLFVNGEFHDLTITDEAQNIKYAEI